MLPTDMKKLREFEDENRRLKKIVADLSLEKEMARLLSAIGPRTMNERASSNESSETCSQKSAG